METRQPASLRSLILATLLLTLTGFGCSAQDWRARIYIVKAEEAHSKAYTMRIHKEVPYEERLGYYRQACDFFTKAYQIDPRTFTLNRIGSAAESCLRIEDFEGEEMFRQFEEEYIKTHPDETKYGEAGAFMSLE